MTQFLLSNRAIKRFFLFFLTLTGSSVSAATYTAATGNVSDIQAAQRLTAVSGDTILVPPGTYYWTSTLTITNGIQLIGAGTNNTIIVDEIPRSSGSANAFGISSALTPANVSFRISGFQFMYGVTNTTLGQNGFIHMEGNLWMNRIDNCFFNQLYQVDYVKIAGWNYGVTDHSYFLLRGRTQAQEVWHDTYGNAAKYCNGDGSWADYSNFGSSNFWFSENVTFDNSLNNFDNGATDSEGGGRWVYRYCNYINCKPNAHGTETSRRVRGYRAGEIYSNTIVNLSLGSTTSFEIRGGVMYIWGNTETGSGANQFNGNMALSCYREIENYPPWGGSNGTNEWDVNTSGGPFTTGTATGTNGSPQLTDANQNWTVNQWVGYSVIDLNIPSCANTVPAMQGFSHITSNTSNTLYFAPDTSAFAPAMLINNGDSYAIYQVVASLDQCGRGKGALISGGSSTVAPTPNGWTGEMSDPCYEWNNTVNGKPIAWSVSAPNNYPSIVIGRDAFDAVAPGYTPYTYPHPLVSGIPSVAPPTNLRVAGPG